MWVELRELISQAVRHAEVFGRALGDDPPRGSQPGPTDIEV
jgi:hypothetical protein